MRSHRVLIFVVLLCVLLVACSTSRMVIALNVASLCVSAASTAIASVSELDTTLQSEIVTYLNAVSTALSTAATNLKSGTLTVLQIASITAALNAAVVPALPDAVPASVKTTLVAVSVAVEKFIELLASQTTVALTAPAARVTIVRISLSGRDRELLNESLASLAQADATLASIHPATVVW
jgi:hypothetical protein